MSLTNLLRVAVAGLALSASGCTTILGDFELDKSGGQPNQTDGGAQGDIVVEPTTGLITTEQGSKATFTIVLVRQPTDNVAVALSSSNPAEGTVSPGSVTFTPDNYDAPQTVTITGVDDELIDGNQTYTILTSPASSSDSSYAGTDPIDLSVVNVDDETAGFTVIPSMGLTTSESGGEDSFTIVLNSEPTADVTIGLSSSNPAEGTVGVESVTFTLQNWNAPQEILVTGVDDGAADGPQSYSIVTAPATSADTGYDRLDPEDVSVTNQDNDTAGISLSPAEGLMTGESGQMAMFGIVLNSPPAADVVIGLSSSDENEGVVSPQSVTFTTLNWMAPQIVTVSGLDDAAADGNQPYEVLTAPADSEDPGYAGLDGPDAQITNIDNDSPGLTVSPTIDLVTSEAGMAVDFTVVLNSQPSGDVLLDVLSNAEDEGVATPALVAFTQSNWNAPQTITVMGADDAIADGSQPYLVHLTPNPATIDEGYAALSQVDVALSNTDDDSAGITVTGQAGLTTGEQGMSAMFTIVLNSEPTANVTIALSSSNTAEGTVSPASVTFTPNNYNAPQTVTVSGADDDVADGNQPYRVTTAPAVSDDPAYATMNASDVNVVNTDDDSPGITVTPTQGLTTTEAGGSAFFTIVLNSEPTANVRIALSSTNTAEGVVSPASVSFTAQNWNAPQTVTITGQNDDVADGAQQYRITTAQAVSDDAAYAAIDPFDVVLSNTDNDSAGITVTSAPMLTTTEAGGAAAFTVVLNSKPTASVTIPLSSSNTGEGTVSPASLTFSTVNWNAPQTVTVTGVDDAVADGNQQYTIRTQSSTSGDPQYNARNAADVSVTNTDNDSAGITVTPTTGLITSEAGTSAGFTIVLNSRPLANVTVPLRSSRTGEGTVSPSSVTFTADNWNAPRTITVTGVNDNVADGAQPYSIVTDPATSTDAKYSMMNAFDVSVSNVDNDSAGITVTVSDNSTSEGGGTASFSIVLNSEPTASVTIPLSSSDTSEGTLSVSSVTFTSMNWSAPQTITVTGANDAVADGAQPYSVVVGVSTSSDGNYNGLNPPDVALSNVDNDSAGITVSPALGATTEGGVSTTFSIVLNSQPTADVTIPLSSSDPGEGTISVDEVVFTANNWSAPKIITVTGVNDNLADGEQPYSIIVGVSNSTDTGYDNLNPPDVLLSNVDNDSAGITVGAASQPTTEDGGTATFTIVLNSEPTANVTIPISSSKPAEGALSQSSVVFTPMNWAAPQLVTVTGQNDDVADGTQLYTIVTGSAASMDTGYSGMNPGDVAMSNVDDDSAGITVSAAAGSTTEAGVSTSFTIVLNSQPTASVTIPISSADTSEGTLTQSSVVFTVDNWSSAQTITITGVNDNVADGDQPYSIAVEPATSADDAYDGMDGNDVAVVNVDNDSAGITVSAASGPTSESGASATFTIVLNSQPTAGVTIALSSSDTSEGTLTQTSVAFTTSNWSAPQEITVQGVDDDVADGDQPYSIVTAKATSADAAYAAINPDDVLLSNVDNDSAGFTIEGAQGTTSEGGASTTFSIVLNSQPTAAVTIPLSSNDPGEGDVLVSSVTFNAMDWDAPKVVSVVGADDAVADGPQQYKILTGPAVSSDTGYSGKNPADVDVTNLDNDSALVVVTQPTTPVTGEAANADPATFSVVLTSKPTANVTIPLLSMRPSEGVIVDPSPAQLVFTENNWNVAQIVTVKGVQDSVADGNQPYIVQVQPAVSSDAGYDGLDGNDVNLSNTDDDSAGMMLIAAPDLSTSEGGDLATFKVVLNSQPLAPVSIPLRTADASEVRFRTGASTVVSNLTLDFTVANWNAEQTVTLVGQNDAVADGSPVVTIFTDPSASDDPDYDNLDLANVLVTNVDDDTPSILITSMSCETTPGTSSTFTIELTSEPTASVMIGLSTDPSTQGSVDPVAVTFDAATWDQPVVVTVTGLDDGSGVPGDKPFTVLIDPAISTDPNYDGRDAANLACVNTVP